MQAVSYSLNLPLLAETKEALPILRLVGKNFTSLTLSFSSVLDQMKLIDDVTSAMSSTGFPYANKKDTNVYIFLCYQRTVCSS